MTTKETADTTYYVQVGAKVVSCTVLTRQQHFCKLKKPQIPTAKMCHIIDHMRIGYGKKK